MLNNKTLKQYSMFSKLSGHNFYHEIEQIQDSLGNTVYIAEHAIAGMMVSIRYNTGAKMQEEPKQLRNLPKRNWEAIVQKPVKNGGIPWPQDVVCSEMSFGDKTQIGLAFKPEELIYSKSTLKNILIDEVNLGWKNERNMTLVNNILDLCESIQLAGYEYHCYDMDRIFYDEDLRIKFDFSTSLTRICDDDNSTFNRVEKEDVGKEFLPPWFDMEIDNNMSLSDDNYSMTALIFRLMVGRLPYQGRNMDGKGHLMNLADVGEKQHFDTLREYRRNNIFIFDRDNTSNSIGEIQSEKRYIDLWEELPEDVRGMFYKTFVYDYADSTNRRRCTFSPTDWKKALKEMK